MKLLTSERGALFEVVVGVVTCPAKLKLRPVLSERGFAKNGDHFDRKIKPQ